MSAATANSRIRVLVVDDSVLMGRQIAGILSEDKDIEVVGRAKDGIECLEMVESLRPDVVTLDVEMPRMNGITALKHIMVRYSVPTVMISALTKEGARTTFDALRYGAVDVISKPSRREGESLEAQKTDIVTKVKKAATIRMGRSRYVRMPSTRMSKNIAGGGPPDADTRFIGIGAGTGGYYSLLRIIPALPADFNDVILAVILVSPQYVRPFIAYLDENSALPVKHIMETQVVQKGMCYLTSEREGFVLDRSADGSIVISPQPVSPPGNGTGTIDRMFKALARLVGNRAVGMVMSGPGKDGAEGAAEIDRAGGITVIQDINNCVDPAMPLAVLQRGTMAKIIPDYMMAEFITTGK